MDAYRSYQGGYQGGHQEDSAGDTARRTPLVLLHGVTGSWPIWRPILPALAAAHRVFAPTLPGHYGAATLPAGRPAAVATLADMLEAQLDAEGIERAHLVGNSLGGWLALELGRRGRARSVVALSPAGAWETRADQQRVVHLIGRTMRLIERFAGVARRIVRSRWGRRLLLQKVMEHGERVPYAEVLELLDAAIGCAILPTFLANVSSAASFARSDAPRDYPVRIAWAEFDRTIPFARYGRPMLAAVPGSELVHLHGVGHVPMYDDPALVARTILEVTQATDAQLKSPKESA